MSNYIDNKTFVQIILKYKLSGDKKLQNEIGKCFISIVNGLLRNPSFINYSSDRHDEMMSEALFYMSKKLPTYTPDVNIKGRDNPFSYFTMIAYRAIIQRINFYNRRDKIFKPINYIESFENKVLSKSTLFKNEIDSGGNDD
jgi:hypothetical protein